MGHFFEILSFSDFMGCRSPKIAKNADFATFGLHKIAKTQNFKKMPHLALELITN
jgi:hypothetical protein